MKATSLDAVSKTTALNLISDAGEGFAQNWSSTKYVSCVDLTPFTEPMSLGGGGARGRRDSTGEREKEGRTPMPIGC